MLDGIQRENQRNGFYPIYESKIREIVLPTLVDNCIRKEKSPDTHVSMVFAGNFYSSIRNPEKMLEVLSGLPKRYLIHLYGTGCRSIVKAKMESFQDAKLVDHGEVLHEQCIKAIQDADFLINLSNTITNQLPSKVFEYMSSGKPIINFYYSEDDLGLKYLKKYPLCININLNRYTVNDCGTIIEFCEENLGKQLTFDKISDGLSDICAEKVIGSIADEICPRTKDN